MNRALSNVLLFTAGAVVGSVVTWKIFKSRYEFIEEDYYEECAEESDGEDEVDDEVETDRFADESDSSAEIKPSANTKPPLKEYVQMVKQLSYSDVEAYDEEDEDVYEPYIIRPEEYGEIHAYETLSLNYYADGVLTDDLDNQIEDVESLVPADFADHFGEYEDYTVFVRNDERQCDYEILRDTRNFADVVGEDPYPTEDE